MTLAGDVGRYLEAVGQPDAGDLAQRRVGLFRRGRVHAGAHAPLLRAGFQRGHLVALARSLARLADQLVNRRHCGPSRFRGRFVEFAANRTFRSCKKTIAEASKNASRRSDHMPRGAKPCFFKSLRKLRLERTSTTSPLLERAGRIGSRHPLVKRGITVLSSGLIRGRGGT